MFQKESNFEVKDETKNVNDFPICRAKYAHFVRNVFSNKKQSILETHKKGKKNEAVFGYLLLFRFFS